MNIVNKIIYLVIIYLAIFNVAIATTSSVSNGLFNITWTSEEGEIYLIENSTNLITDPFSNLLNDGVNATPPENNYQITTDKEVAFYRISEKIVLEGDFTITQNWSQETNFERPVKVAIPNGSGPFPVVIHLHGFGGTGNVNAISYLNNVIRVAPDGYQN